MEYLYESFEKKLSLVPTSFNDLPDVLVIDILSRLPVKTLIQSTSINKSCYSLIKNPSFISIHLSRNISDSSNYCMLLFHRNSPSLTVVSEINNVLTRKPDIVVPFETKSKSQQVVGTCHGLVCLTDYDVTYHGHDIYLINPFIHKYKNIGVESSSHVDFIMENSNCKINVAFGYSKVDNDYKIVRILDAEKPHDVWITKAEVYSLKSGKWRDLEVSTGMLAPRKPLVLIDGCLYWIILFDYALYCQKIGWVLCFNLEDEVFSTLNNLPIVGYPLCDSLQNGTLDKNGYFAFYNKFPVNYYPYERICIDVLEKDSNGGQKEVQWKQFHREGEDFVPDICMGISKCSGKLIFVKRNWEFNRYMLLGYVDNMSEIDERLLVWIKDGKLPNWSMVAVDDKSFGFEEKLVLDFNDYFSGACNVIESLVLFSD